MHARKPPVGGEGAAQPVPCPSTVAKPHFWGCTPCVSSSFSAIAVAAIAASVAAPVAARLAAGINGENQCHVTDFGLALEQEGNVVNCLFEHNQGRKRKRKQKPEDEEVNGAILRWSSVTLFNQPKKLQLRPLRWHFPVFITHPYIFRHHGWGRIV